jgi:hypothetical protein
MTIPSTTILPLHSERIKQGGDELDKYLRELVTTLQKQYEEVAQGINGDFRSNFDEDSKKYTPTVSGSTSDGSGTYTHQIGWVHRRGVLVDYWFDIRWSAHTGTGDLEVDLPYLSIETEQYPFVCHVSVQNITFSGYLTGTIDPGTRKLQIYDNVSGTTFNNIALTNSDTTIRGHLRYVAQTIERS